MLTWLRVLAALHVIGLCALELVPSTGREEA